MGHMAAMLGGATHLFGVSAGYRQPKRWAKKASAWLTLETMLIAGTMLAVAGGLVLVGVMLAWFARDFGPTDSVLPAVLGALLLTLGFQTFMGGFLLAIVAGNEARFLARPTADREAQALEISEAAAA